MNRLELKSVSKALKAVEQIRNNRLDFSKSIGLHSYMNVITVKAKRKFFSNNIERMFLFYSKIFLLEIKDSKKYKNVFSECEIETCELLKLNFFELIHNMNFDFGSNTVLFV